MELIAEAADLSRATLYKYFPTKEAIFAAAVSELLSEAQKAVEIANEVAETASSVDRLSLLLIAWEQAFALALRGSPHHAELNEIASERCGVEMLAARGKFLTLLAKTVEELIKARRITGSSLIKPRHFAEILYTAAHGVKSTTPPPSEDELAAGIRGMTRILVAGYGAVDKQ
jgi:AcrR family transcriptional regulator